MDVTFCFQCIKAAPQRTFLYIRKNVQQLLLIQAIIKIVEQPLLLENPHHISFQMIILECPIVFYAFLRLLEQSAPFLKIFYDRLLTIGKDDKKTFNKIIHLAKGIEFIGAREHFKIAFLILVATLGKGIRRIFGTSLRKIKARKQPSNTAIAIIERMNVTKIIMTNSNLDQVRQRRPRHELYQILYRINDA